MEPREIYVIRRMATNEFMKRHEIGERYIFDADVTLAMSFANRNSAEDYARGIVLYVIPGKAERLEVVRIKIEEIQAWLVPSPTHEKTK
jgi:hypothetical protein